MIDWYSIFDKSNPLAGASAAEIERFVTSISAPLSPAEIDEINRAQRNPYPKSDPLYQVWRPFDPSRWVIPARPLSPSYLALLRWSNGGEFQMPIATRDTNASRQNETFNN